MSPTLKPMDQQVIVVTGASSGIGLATVREAARRGARVLLVARDEPALAGAVQEIVTGGGTADFKATDVGDWEQVRAAAAHAVQRFGRIDTWVNCAGVTIYGRLLDTPGDEHAQLFRTNYFGVVHGCLAAVPQLKEHGGALITVASVAADMPTPLMGAYAASKHAVKGYVETLRAELIQEGAPVSVTLVKPSGIATPIADHAANHLGGRAMVPPPVYDPAIVADAILACAVTPRREITIGGGGKAQALLAEHAPPLFDRLAAAASASFVDLSDAQPEPHNLFGPARDGAERSEKQSGRSVSVYTAAARRPAATALAIGALAGGAAWLAAGRRG